MPRIVDYHAERERLAEAAWRTIAREGLQGATMRAVAEQAGCSTGPLVHYFGDKNQILVHALRHAARRTGGRMVRRLQSSHGIAGLRSLLEEALPLDNQRRAEWRIWLSFWGGAAADPTLAAEQKRRYEEWRGLIRVALAGARFQGELPRGLDLEQTAEEIVALVDGIGIQAMFERDRFPRARQLAIIGDFLKRLSAAPR